MADLLVPLYGLPALEPALERVRGDGCDVRRALAPEKHLVTRWVGEQFSAAWASECEVGFARVPLACFLAVRGAELCGFAAYEATCRNFFGPLGVRPDCGGAGLGAALLLSALHAMRGEGYAYAIIGGAGPAAFFEKLAGAIAIPGSEPGIHRGMLR
ncbi:MAG: GNAT family N-acetyltransferase [Verrucomicrobiota bacterium]|nr:GNAT family N-acetyltransferase [Verrucomicrobiota bacterium]